MANISDNLARWTTYAWPEGGDEWSAIWGGTPILWWGSLFPRLQAYLPAATILEIAPGFGRCTQYLQALCDRLILVDLTPRCIEACKARFASLRHLRYPVNDGRSLAMVPEGSIDFAFSFDSLVHAEADVLRAYLRELRPKLRKDGVGFFHHSNVGAFRDPASGAISIPNPHWRATSMSAALFESFCAEAELRCVAQELLDWGIPHLTDCFSVLTLPGSRHDRPNLVIDNGSFMQEAHYLARYSRLYAPPARKS